MMLISKNVKLTEKECLKALKTMEPGKSPGMSGLRAKFNKGFYTLSFIHCFIHCCNESHQKGIIMI